MSNNEEKVINPTNFLSLSRVYICTQMRNERENARKTHNVDM